MASAGRRGYPQAQHVLILADTGGGNAAARGAWKDQLQQQLCDRCGLTVTVAHYPTGASKYNPIERRLFSRIAENNRPIVKTEPGGGEFENVILFSFELTLPGG